MIRVLQIVGSLERAGSPGQMALLSGRLPAEGFEVRVFSLGGSGPLAAELAEQGVEVLEWPARRHAGLRTLAWLRGAILRFSPHLVHAWPSAGNAGTGDVCVRGALDATAVGVRRIVVAERAEVRPAAWPRPLTDRLLIRWVRRCVANSPRVRDACLAAGWPAERVCVIPNGVAANHHDPVRARARLLGELRLPSSARLIGAVGPLEPRKRLKDLIWSADQLNLVRDDCYLLIVGEGPQGWRLRRYRDQVVLRDRVLFLGPRQDVPQLLAGLDCLWIGSQAESVPNCVLEAMAAGIPVVASDIPAHRALVTPGETGFLVPVGSRPGYARQTLPLLRDDELRHRSGQNARQFVQRHYGVDVMVQRYVELYRTLVEA